MTAGFHEDAPPVVRPLPRRQLHGLGAWTPGGAWRVDPLPPPRERSSRTASWVPGLVLLAADVVAFAAAAVLTKTVSLKTLTLLALVVGFFYTADLYRSRLTLSILDDTPTILGRSLAAGAGAMVLGGLTTASPASPGCRRRSPSVGCAW